ncbi:phage tail sheath C-terminal domain-containing protein [Microcoleus sp. POL10_C6]|uniref:phage tail sheath C-terminal domain-containing protein n=1 Tax=Microcoleus sp. POL10_C6 TaxID=2818852 RepID=UPI002FD58498
MSDRIPGVYLEQQVPIQAPEFLTGVPAFLGLVGNVFADGNNPEPIALWTQFVDRFGLGSDLSPNYLAYAVRGFFENGGRLCYIVPLAFPNRNSFDEAFLNGLKKGLEAIESINTIDLLCIPDLMRQELSASTRITAIGQVLQHCSTMGDRFAILDAMGGWNLKLVGLSNVEPVNAAAYAPWLRVEALSGSQQSGASTELVPPCGHVAGIYAKSDRAGGVRRSPANYPLEGILDLEPSRIEIASPTPLPGTNHLQAFRGRGIRIWGASTLSQHPDWQYISVRRLFLTVHRWVQFYLTDVAFEPNDFRLWIRIGRELNAYFESLFQQGALKGRTLQEAFYVKCDAQTNPPEVRDSGKVVTEIGLAPTVPSEFIIIRLVHGSSGLTVNSE